MIYLEYRSDVSACSRFITEPTTTIRIRVKKNDSYEDVNFKMLDPHILLHHLVVTAGLRIPAACCQEFWEFKRNVAREEWAIRSPATSTHVPLALYGDGVRLYNNGDPTKMYGVWLSLPLWRAKSARCSRWCIAAIESTKLYGTMTLDAILERVAYSLNLLFHGRDENGAEICDKQVFCLTELKGDWEWHKLVFQFDSSWVSKSQVCFKCEAKARSTDHDELFYSEVGCWQPYDLAAFLEKQLGRRRRTCCVVASSKFPEHPRSTDSRPRVSSRHARDMQHAYLKPGTRVQLERHKHEPCRRSFALSRILATCDVLLLLQGPPAPYQILYGRDVGSDL